MVFVSFFSLAINWHALQWNHEFSFWQSWQISFIVRIGGFLAVLFFASVLFGRGYFDRELYESLVFTNFFIVVLTLISDLTFVLLRLRVAYVKANIQQGEIKDAIIQRKNS